MSSSQEQYDPCDIYRMPDLAFLLFSKGKKKQAALQPQPKGEKSHSSIQLLPAPLWLTVNALCHSSHARHVLGFKGELWSVQFSLSLSLRDSILKLPTFEKLIHTSVRSQGSPASTALGFHWELKSSACPCINSLSIICTSLVPSLPTVNLSIKGINPSWLQLKDGGHLVGDLAAPETWSLSS